MPERYELLICPVCGHRWLTIGAAALDQAEAQALIDDHLQRQHPGRLASLDAFVPAPPAKTPRPPSRRNRR